MAFLTPPLAPQTRLLDHKRLLRTPALHHQSTFRTPACTPQTSVFQHRAPGPHQVLHHFCRLFLSGHCPSTSPRTRFFPETFVSDTARAPPEAISITRFCTTLSPFFFRTLPEHQVGTRSEPLWNQVGSRNPRSRLKRSGGLAKSAYVCVRVS